MKNTRLFAAGMISGLVLVSVACSSFSSITSLFATPTPTPTNTPTPTPTPLPTATPTVTPTMLPQGVETEEQEDGSTLVVDRGNGFQFVLPDGWVVIPLTAEDISKLLDAAAEANPDMANMVETFKQLDSDVVRVVALSDDPKYVTKGFATNITVTAIEDKMMASMPLEIVTAMLEDSLTEQGATVLTQGANVGTNAHDVEYGIVDCKITTKTASGGALEVRSIYAIFQTDKKMVMIDLTTPSKFGKELFKLLGEVIDTIEMTD